MKKSLFIASVFSILFTACQKTASVDATTITASTTEATVGQSVLFTVSTNANAVSWSATPAAGCTKAYNITTDKQNTITFTAAGDYTVGVRTRKMEFGLHHSDSTWHHHGIDSAFHHQGGHQGVCNKGKDSASIVIKVR